MAAMPVAGAAAKLQQETESVNSLSSSPKIVKPLARDPLYVDCTRAAINSAKNT